LYEIQDNDSDNARKRTELSNNENRDDTKGGSYGRTEVQRRIKLKLTVDHLSLMPIV
jgi:hypothetical protein